jgi:hypothetical protein
MTYFPTTKITTADTMAVDAFGRLRVSNPVTLSEVSFEYDLSPLVVESITASLGSASFDSNSRTAILSASTTAPSAGVGTVTIAGASNPRTATFTNSQTFSSGDNILVNSIPYRVITGGTGTSFSVDGIVNAAAGSSFTRRGSYSALRQRQVNLYEKGKSHLIKQTFVFGSGTNGVTRRAGYYSDRNGYIFTQETATGSMMVGFIERTAVTGNVVETFFSQSQWNIDKLDGQGPSGHTLDLTKHQILITDAQFLGVGRVRMGFDLDGLLVPCHEFLHANTSSIAPYMQTFSLPVTYEIFNHTSSVGADMKCICFEVESEGGTLGGPPRKNRFSANSGTAAGVTVTTSRTFVLAVRPKQTYNGNMNRMVISPQDITAIIGNNSVLVELIYDPVLTGGSWASVNDNSGMEFSTNATYTSGGTVVNSFFVGTGGNTARASGGSVIAESFPIVNDNFGANPKVIAVIMTATATTSVCYATIDWEETR